jgi:hypothetical protein
VPTGFTIKALNLVNIQHLCSPYDSYNKQQLFAHTASPTGRLKIRNFKCLTFGNLDVWDREISWSHILITVLLPFVASSDELRWAIWLASRLSPLSCYCADHSQLSRALSFIKSDWQPSFHIFYASKRRTLLKITSTIFMFAEVILRIFITGIS